MYRLATKCTEKIESNCRRKREREPELETETTTSVLRKHLSQSVYSKVTNKHHTGIM